MQSLKKKITIIFALVLVAIMLFTSLAPVFAANFSDTEDDLYKDGIEFLRTGGIINGYPDGTYKPEQTLNRAEMIKIIAEGAKVYYTWPANTFDGYEKQSCFSDVPANQWYTKYVCYGKDKGWVVGYENGKYFRPTQTVTFVESLKIGMKGFALGYSEVATPWYKDVVEAASKKNYIPFDIHAFDSGLKRNQMADLVARIIKENEGDLDAFLGDRRDIVVTFETIEAGMNLSELDVEELGNGGSSDTSNDSDDSSDDDGDLAAQTHVITITSSGFSPSSLSIKKGDTVKFVNEDSASHRPASNTHPDHTGYPGSGAEKCGTAEAITSFDACDGLATGASYSFTFNELGTWGFHDHFNPTFTGTVTVEE